MSAPTLPGIGLPVLLWAIIGLALVAGIQTVRLAEAQADTATLEASIATGRATRAEAARADEAETAKRERQHANDTQGASDVFTQGQPARDDRARADAARYKRLYLDADRRAANYHAQAQAGDQACRALADRSEALDRALVQGIGVVGDLRKALERRDAEVALQASIIAADDKLLAGE